MHQALWADITATMTKWPAAPGNGMDSVEMFDMSGGKLLFQRTMRPPPEGLYYKALLDSQQSPTYDLEVSPDGNTAVLTTRLGSPLQMGGPDDNEPFGTIQVAQKLTIDLRPDVPVVTDVQVAQFINP